MNALKSKDIVAGGEGECFYTDESGRRYNFASAISINAKITKLKTKVPVLGQTAKVNKATGVEGTGTMKLHYNISFIRKKMIEYMKTGKDFYFDLQVTNNDKTTALGRQTTILQNCNIDEIAIALLDADAEYLSEDVPFTFDSAELPEEFNLLDTMQ